MRFHLVDRIDAWEPGRWVKARKVASRAEEFWRVRGDRLEMPPWLVVEAICQAGSWLLVLTTEARSRAALASIGSVQFTGAVVPGDVIEIEGEIISLDAEAAVFSGRARVNGTEVVAATDILCVLIDSARLQDPEETARMARLLTGSEAV